jgi:FemAB-related protein (PEP-CTERM system-associated)
MDIRLATDIDQTAWDRYVLEHADGLAYHQYAWRKAVDVAYHFSARYLVAEQNEKFCGVLPLIAFKPPLLGHSYVSLPYCDQAGCLADDPDVEKALVVKARTMAAEDKIESIELRQKAQQAASECLAGGCQKVRMVLELPDSSDILLKGMKSKLRSQVLRPGRDGFRARLGGLELVHEFYRIFSENMRDLGSPVHGRQWIESVVKYYAKNARVGIVYTPDGKPVAGGIILLHGETVSIPWASSLRQFNRFNPNMLLYWTFLSFSADRGFSRFDFGRSTPGEGAYRFKEQWGARPVALDWKVIRYYGDAEQTIFSNSRMRRRVEGLWMRMPLRFCNTFGPLVRRYVSL